VPLPVSAFRVAASMSLALRQLSASALPAKNTNTVSTASNTVIREIALDHVLFLSRRFSKHPSSNIFA
jgi:hypothetical protein